ncbi:hypothetical protein F5Y16DRAFT_398833 [Xylariaceae sp. FL0255]|nr:hypothetical protein F5Y16DRAFT_398833 [Xylariaceae sp. FL0255]
MEFFMFFIAFLFSLVTGAAIDALPPGISIRSSLPSNYTITPVTWIMPIETGGENHTFYGTVQEVFAQVNDARAQQGLPALPDPSANITEPTTRSISGTHSVLDARSYEKTICKVGLSGYATIYRINQGIAYLEGVTSQCGMGAGPGNCGRISCSYNAAIYWCNDNDHYVEYECSYFAQYAAVVTDACVYTRGGKTEWTWGQAFDTENFNVMVGYDSC